MGGIAVRVSETTYNSQAFVVLLLQHHRARGSCVTFAARDGGGAYTRRAGIIIKRAPMTTDSTALECVSVVGVDWKRDDKKT